MRFEASQAVFWLITAVLKGAKTYHKAVFFSLGM